MAAPIENDNVYHLRAEPHGKPGEYRRHAFDLKGCVRNMSSLVSKIGE